MTGSPEARVSALARRWWHAELCRGGSFRGGGPEGLRLGVRPRDVAGGAVLGQQFAQRRGDALAFVDRQRAPPPEQAAGSGVDDLGRLAPVGLGSDVERGPGI